jgi:Raf kinase inhibitor-like YbhB/YbcL family protein
MHDPDAPIAGGFSHWVAWGLPATARGLAQGKPAPVSGANGTGARGYLGPCPPSGVHHYRFVLYALDAPLKLAAGAGRAELLQAIKGHVVARAELVGLFPGR